MWIDKGVLKKLTYSRFWAQKQNKEPDAGTNAVKFQGATTTTDDLIRSTPRGVLVTRLWYLRQVDPRTVLYTGLTRDGTFLIEDGKITKAVKNMRFNESPLFMLNNLEGVGRAVRVAGTEAGGDVVMKSTVPLSRSRITKMNGRSTRTVVTVGTDVTNIPPTVTAAASVPSSSIETKLFCWRNERTN